MSYCVNCGVSLKEDANACPLCDCPVINPYEEYKKYSGDKKPPRPVTDTAPVADWRDLAHFIIALIIVAKLKSFSVGLDKVLLGSRNHLS